MIEWLKIHFSPEYLFQANPHNDTQNIYYLLIFFGLILLLGLFTSIIFKNKSKKIKPYKMYSDKIFSYSMWIGVSGLLYVFFRWQQIPYLSSPIIFVVLLLLFVYFTVKILFHTKKQINKEIINYKQDLDYKKYLPKKQFK